MAEHRYLAGNALVCGDNYAALRELPDECIDLVYLDPPFNSNQFYVAAFGDKGMVASQLRDIWRWTVESQNAFDRLPRGQLRDSLRGIRLQAGENSPMAAYAVFMGVRLAEMRRVGSTIGVTTMVMMAVVMADTGMTVLLARGIAAASGPLFPVVSPFIGLLGSFMSGSNTNSNVMFGLLQLETARALEIGTVTISAVQSIGASVGSPMAPAKVLVGAAVVGLAGQERKIFGVVIPYILILVALVAVEAILLIRVFPALSR